MSRPDTKTLSPMPCLTFLTCAPAMPRLGGALPGMLVVLACLAMAAPGRAQPAADTPPPSARVQTGAQTGLPLPRFVAIKSTPVNVRRGPSFDHPVAWVFVRRGVPVEVTAESDNWRRIQDVDGARGWVFHTLIDGKRTVMVVGPDATNPRTGDLVALRFSPDARSDEVALVEPGFIGALVDCTQGWCAVRMGPHEGFMRVEHLYGVYPDEAGRR